MKTCRQWPVERFNLECSHWREELLETLVGEAPEIGVLIVRCRRAGLAVVPSEEWNRQQEPSVVSQDAHDFT